MRGAAAATVFFVDFAAAAASATARESCRWPPRFACERRVRCVLNEGWQKSGGRGALWMEADSRGANITDSPRVAVIGAGVAGSAFAYELSLHASAANVAAPQVELFEMGRGAGGRASSRGTRELPAFVADHGAPCFRVKEPRCAAVLAQLQQLSPPPVEALSLAELADVRCTDRARNEWTTTSRAAVVLGPPDNAADIFVGRPCMASVSGALVKASCAIPNYQTVVRQVERDADVWVLHGGATGDKLLGRFDVLCVASATPAHSRWRALFGGEPPLHRAAKELGHAELSQRLQDISAVKARPVLALIMAFEGAAAAAWNAQPWTVADVHDDAVLSRVSIGRNAAHAGLISVVLHSTHDFAVQFASAGYGRSSAAERVGGALAGSSDARDAVEQAMMDALLRVGVPSWVAGQHASRAAAVYGPTMHRWGSAFPERAALTSAAAAIMDLKLVFAGDFIADEGKGDIDVLSHVERAMLSGLRAADTVAEMLQWRHSASL